MGVTPKTALPPQDRAASLNKNFAISPHFPPYTLHPTPSLLPAPCSRLPAP
ncbi:hypothetical protein [Moorena sp. SIO3H5]|uniref:hypothetical protein n=1 Tax=Moorena sp. SIO3H5 TaxID=2607834 RepID=UPI0013BD01C8|nr:hypothetical protein [Moorena sp. SIO3H5]NEO70982.1 hypothetical protein [Moorena sp. SIO3H5]